MRFLFVVSFFLLLQKTATPLSGMKRIQMNLKIKQLENFELLTNVTGGVFPLFWVEEVRIIYYYY